MLRIIGVIIGCFWIGCLPASAGRRVAIFDFDKRDQFPAALSLHIENRLKAEIQAITVDHYTGKGDERRSVEILSALDKQGLDLIILRTSDALIIAQHTLFKTPTLYTNVNNPTTLGFQTIGPPGGNISGVSYYIPIETHMAVYKTLQPGLKRPGFIFDKKNKSRKAEIPEAKLACLALGLLFDVEFVENRTQLPGAVKALLNRGADAIIATSSGVIYENIDAFLDLTAHAGVPVFSLYKTGVYKGAVAALSSDFFQMADELLIPMALKVLRHKVSPGEMAAAFLKTRKVFINTAQARKFHLKLPANIIVDGSKFTIETFKP